MVRQSGLWVGITIWRTKSTSHACTGDMLVLIRWGDRKLAVPLSQLAAIDENQSTDQAIADWQYWLAQGYLF